MQQDATLPTVPPNNLPPDVLPPGRAGLIPFSGQISRWPWWALVAALIGILFAWTITTNTDYNEIFRIIVSGIFVTLRVTFFAYVTAAIIGLILALGRVSNNLIAYQISTFYVEIVRGVPTLVLLLYIAYVGIPSALDTIKAFGVHLLAANILPFIGEPLSKLRLIDVSDEATVTVALAIAYSAFISEIFRAGIESIESGQMEAARALGMTYRQAMRHVILRQAIRRVLPPLGNDFIAMLKDSSLVAVIGVPDITRQAKTYSATNFHTLETYNILAYLYLVMTLLLSFMVKWVERTMARERRKS